MEISKRDWGYAPDYVEGMWQILQYDTPFDFVLATNETHTVREFVDEASKLLDMDIEWTGKGVEEKGINKKTGRTVISIDPKLFRPAEVEYLHGDNTLAKEKLKWIPKTTFKQLVKIMVEADFEKEKNSNLLP